MIRRQVRLKRRVLYISIEESGSMTKVPPSYYTLYRFMAQIYTEPDILPEPRPG